MACDTRVTLSITPSYGAKLSAERVASALKVHSRVPHHILEATTRPPLLLVRRSLCMAAHSPPLRHVSPFAARRKDMAWVTLKPGTRNEKKKVYKPALAGQF